MTRHVMIDLETLSTSPNAVVFQIGAQAFDLEAGSFCDAGLMMYVDAQEGIRAGLDVDWSTIKWWMTVPDNDRIVSGSEISIREALTELGKYVRRNDRVWSNGAAFDIPIMENHYRRARMDIPWKYHNVLDVRTLKWLKPAPRVEPIMAHHALSDAQAQALWVIKMMA